MNLEAFVRALAVGDDRSIADEGIVNTRVRHQVGLEFVQIDIESAVEPQARGDRADHLRDQAVEMLIVGTGNVQVAAANVVDGLVVHEEGAVGVFNGAVGGENGIVGLYDGSGDAWGGIDGELQLGLLAVVGGKTLEKERSETRPSATAEGVEDQEALEGAAVVCVRVSLFCFAPQNLVNIPATRRMRSMTLSTSSLPMV